MEDNKELTQEQVVDTAVQEDVKEVEVPQEETVETLTKDEVDKLLQSTSSKAKNEILEKIGLKSVDDIKSKITRAQELEELASEYDALKAEHAELKDTFTKRENTELLKSLNVNEKYGDLFLELVDKENGDMPRIEKAKVVKERLAGIVNADIQAVRVGASKTPDNDKASLEDKLKELRKL